MSQAVLKNSTTDLRPANDAMIEGRKEIAESVGNILSDAFRLNINVQGLHWNVEGPLFYSLHKLTEEQYEALTASIDDLAERIRALGLASPQSLKEFSDRSILDDLPEQADVRERVERLIGDYERASVRLRDAVKLAEKYADVKTADLLTDQLGFYEEFAWMLRATVAPATRNSR